MGINYGYVQQYTHLERGICMHSSKEETVPSIDTSTHRLHEAQGLVGVEGHVSVLVHTEDLRVVHPRKLREVVANALRSTQHTQSPVQVVNPVLIIFSGFLPLSPHNAMGAYDMTICCRE